MRIYPFSELSEEHKRNIYQFIGSFEYKSSFGSYEEMAKLYEGIAFDNGNSHFSLWESKKLIGTLGVISKDVAIRGEIFLVSINIKEQDSDKLALLLSKTFDYCSGIKAAKFMLGIMYDRYYLIPAVEESDFKEAYRNLVMSYNGGDVALQEKADKCFKTLCPENIKDYQQVENAAFLLAPNGAIIEDEELQDYLDEYCGNNLAGIYYENDKPTGVYTLKIKDNVGWIESIGVAPEFHGCGIGKKGPIAPLSLSHSPDSCSETL